MKLTEIAIKRPLFILMVILSLIVFGAISYTQMGADLLPSMNVPIVSISVSYPGAGPEEIETKITKPLESAIISVANIDHVTSTSAEGVSSVMLQFTDAASPDMAAIDVERKVNAIASALPQDSSAPSISKMDMNALPIMNLSVTGGTRPMDQLFNYVNDAISPRLQTIEGVASVQLVGGLQRELDVKVDETKLKARGLSISQVSSALGQQNMSMPAGTIADSGKSYDIRLSGLVQDPNQLNDLVVATSPSIVRLKDVATVQDTFAKVTRLSRTDGKESIGIIITKQPTANTMIVAANVRKVLTDLTRTMPPDIKLVTTSDTSTFVQQSLDSVQRSLVEAVILTGIVLLLFLHTFRSTIIVLFAIPTSLISTFVVMHVLGFTLNMMSMYALALSVGILVDDSIVVLENIFRHLKMGKTPWTAALEGRSEIGLAAIAITLVDVVVYTPIALMSGTVGQMFRQFGLTIAIATLFSLFISFTLTPMLASRWLKAGGDHFDRGPWSAFSRGWENGFESLRIWYGSLLGWALRHRIIVLVIAAFVFFGSLAMVPLGFIPTEYVPATDQGQFSVSLEMPAGTTLDVTNERITRIEAVLAKVPELDKFQTSVGGGGRTASARSGSIAVQLVAKSARTRSTSQVLEDVRRQTTSISDATIRFSEASAMGGGGAAGGGGAISVSIKGDDPAVLSNLAGKVQSVMQNTPGTKDINNGSTPGSPEIQILIDHQKAADLGLTASQIASALRTGFDGTIATQFRPTGLDEVNVRVQMQNFNARDVSLIGSIPLLTSRGMEVRLDQVATIVDGKGPVQISRQDRQRVVSVSSSLAPGQSLGPVSARIAQGIRTISVPEGYTVSFGGQTSGMNDAFSGLALAFGLSLLLMYMLMVALYESLIYPFIIMFSIPVSVVGALLALMVTGNPLSMVSAVGFIMLTGLVAKNGILLVDFTNNLRSRGIERNQAIREAGPVRLRPILMTTMAMVFAMLPGAMKLGEGAELGAPMAIVVIGGLLSSMFLTLVLVPVVYTVVDDFQQRVLSLFKRTGKQQQAEASSATN